MRIGMMLTHTRIVPAARALACEVSAVQRLSRPRSWRLHESNASVRDNGNDVNLHSGTHWDETGNDASTGHWR